MKVKDVQSRIVNGAVIECVENTYRPELNGTLRKVTKAQKQNYRWVAIAADGTEEAKPSWGHLPKRESDILASTNDTVTFKMEQAGVGHTLTLRFREARS